MRSHLTTLLAVTSLSVTSLSGAAFAQLGAHVAPAKRDATRSAVVKPPASALQPQSTTTALVGGADDCATPDVVMPGTIAFDNAAATTGTQGQSETACSFAATTGITRDVWFTFVAPSSGVASVTSCGTTTIDSKIAAYADSGCPSAAAIACSDDACGLQSTITFAVTSGASYLLQVGSYPGAAGGSGTLELTIVAGAPNDDCASAIAISAAGPHPFDNGAATTGVQGQGNGACLFLGTTAIAHDVWFTWTAAASGFHEIVTCGGTSVDTKLAVYAGASCPAGAPLACNEDRCGLQSSLCFQATSGAAYTIQLGTFPNAAGGVGSFTIQPTGGATNDDCANATAIGGFGPFAFDNSAATTSCQGQSNSICSFYGQPGITRDTWFRWSAPSNGHFRVGLCGTSGAVDTKLAVYDGGGCPSAPAIACDDDGCGTFAGEPRACFAAIAGQTYTFQVGSYPGAPAAAGSFSVQSVAAPGGCRHDDGASENAIGSAGGGAVAWLHRFGASGQTTSITSVSAAFGTPQFPGATPPVGTPVVAAVWEDPNDDGNPADAVLLRQVSGVVAHVDVDVLDVFALDPPVSTSGTWFAGVSIAHGPNQFPAALDQTSCPASSNGRAWIVASASGSVDLANLTANSTPPTQPDALGLPGVWLVRTQCTSTLGTAYCFGDGSGTACPCDNSGAPGRGCASSVEPMGALLRATGVASVSSDGVVLLGSGMPETATCLYFQGTAPASAIFGDGIRCVGGAIVRLATKLNALGASQFPASGDPTITARCNGYTPPQPIPPGATRHYQTWYRNAAAFCTSATFNLANGVTIAWTP